MTCCVLAIQTAAREILAHCCCELWSSLRLETQRKQQNRLVKEELRSWQVDELVGEEMMTSWSDQSDLAFGEFLVVQAT